MRTRDSTCDAGHVTVFHVILTWRRALSRDVDCKTVQEEEDSSVIYYVRLANLTRPQNIDVDIFAILYTASFFQFFCISRIL